VKNRIPQLLKTAIDYPGTAVACVIDVERHGNVSGNKMTKQPFKRYSGGKTLHQLRHSRLTHLSEANVSAPC
jgi:hypothetical protein